MSGTLADLEADLKRALSAAATAATESESRAYLVGGPVRDLQLGLALSDLDIAVDGRPERFAIELSLRLKGTLRSFPRFLTWKIILNEGAPVDVTTCRRERYPAPGALPDVEPSTIQEDLYRRDFTVNAMAIDLHSGKLIDFGGGLADLEKQVLRVLHEKSFLDDPTRVLRGIRFGHRLDFRFDAETERLLMMAIDGRAMGTVTRERVWRELLLAMDEPKAGELLIKILERGALNELLETDGLGKEVKRVLLAADQGRETGQAIDYHLFYTALVLLRNVDPLSAMAGSGFSDRRIRGVLEIIDGIERLSPALTGETDERSRVVLLRGKSEETLAALLAWNGDLEPTILRARELRGMRLTIRGDELGVVSGPHIARALEVAREALFWGDIGPEGVDEYARALARSYLKA